MYQKNIWKNGDTITAEKLNRMEEGIANALTEIPDNGNSAGVPSGSVIAWYGNSDNIPEGWVLCDGTNGTPDLRDKFVLGAGTSYAVGATGGEITHKLTTLEMPSHTHMYSMRAIVSKYAAAGTENYGLNGSSTSAQYSTGSTGSGTPHNNMPPYYALLYIMKL